MNDWLRYANQGATRNMPLNTDLVNALGGFLPGMGVTMEVFSGGQPGVGSGGARVGSTRHDHGNAADVFFSQNGRRLDWANPEDVPVFQDIVRKARSAGVTGFGAGPGYMQPGSMHIGMGTPGVWGAGGRGANAPDWLRTAFDGASSGSTPVMAARSPQPSAIATEVAQLFGGASPAMAPTGAPQDQPLTIGGVPLGRVAAQFMRSQNRRSAEEQATQDADEQQRRTALLSTVAKLYGA